MYRMYREIQNLDQNFSLKSRNCCKTSPSLKAPGWPLYMAPLRSALARYTLVVMFSISVHYGIPQISPWQANIGCHVLCISTIWHPSDQSLLSTHWLPCSLINTIWHPLDQSLLSTLVAMLSYQYNMTLLRTVLAKHTLVAMLSVSVRYGTPQISPC